VSWIEKTPNGRWKARYRIRRGGKISTRSKTFNRKIDAEKWHRSQLSRKDRGEWIDPRHANTLFGDWTEHVMASRVHLAPSTQARDESYMRNLVLPHLADQRLGSITQTDLEAWISQLISEGYASATIKKASQLASIVFNAAVDSDLISRSPARSLNLPKTQRTEMRFLTAPQVAALAEATGPQHRTLVLTAAYTGLRWGEVTGLRIQRLDLLRRTVTVTEAASEVRGHISWTEPKTAASRRSVVLPRFLCDELAAHLAAYPPGADGLVFTSPQGDPLRRTNFRRRVWLPATSEVGLEGVRFHDLRHTHAAMLIAQGEHPKVIQSRLGHASITTTLNTYGHLSEGLDEAAADRLDDAWNQAPAPATRPDGDIVALSAS
jgi:integrase